MFPWKQKVPAVLAALLAARCEAEVSVGRRFESESARF